MVKVTNSRKAAHTIFVKGAAIRVAPGETKDVELTNAEIEDLKGAGLDVSKATTKAAKAATEGE